MNKLTEKIGDSAKDVVVNIVVASVVGLVAGFFHHESRLSVLESRLSDIQTDVRDIKNMELAARSQ